MVHDPRRGDKQHEKAASLFFFFVAVLVMIIGAGIELLQQVPPLQIRSNVILFLLLTVLVLLAYRARRLLR